MQGLVSESSDVKLATGDNGEEPLVIFIKEIEPFVGAILRENGPGDGVQLLDALTGVGKGGDELQITVVGGLE
ncbi:MAG: hypothetical protein DDT30_01484 [Dehalococcoidia bacterium]|nr:hypothetical protein [Bacillota bacterium]